MIRIADAHSDFLGFKTMQITDSRLFDHADIDRMLRGGVKLQTFAVWVPAECSKKAEAGLEQIRFLHTLIENNSCNIHICTKHDHLKAPGISALLSIESGDSIDCLPDNIQTVYDMGARMLSLTWNGENEFASGCSSDGGLKPSGITAIDEMNRLHMALDVSHINEQGFWEALENYEGKPCASHSCVYDICPSPRNLKRDQIKILVDREGYIGINFYTEFLRGRYACIGDILDHIDYVLDCGGEDAVGFGSDFCGIQYTPAGLNSVADFQKVPEAMFRRGYAEKLVNKICYGNFARFVLEFLQ